MADGGHQLAFKRAAFLKVCVISLRGIIHNHKTKSADEMQLQIDFSLAGAGNPAYAVCSAAVINEVIGGAVIVQLNGVCECYLIRQVTVIIIIVVVVVVVVANVVIGPISIRI